MCIAMKPILIFILYEWLNYVFTHHWVQDTGVNAHVDKEVPQFISDIVEKTYIFQLKLGKLNFTSKHQTFIISCIITEQQHPPLPRLCYTCWYLILSFFSTSIWIINSCKSLWYHQGDGHVPNDDVHVESPVASGVGGGSRRRWNYKCQPSAILICYCRIRPAWHSYSCAKFPLIMLLQ